MDKKEVLRKITDVSNYLYEKGLVPGKSGNVSFRFVANGSENVAITPSGVSLKDVDEKNIVIVDMDGNKLNESLENDKKASSEVFMHINVYKKNDEVNGIVHTHSPVATGFAFAEEKIKRLEGFGTIKNPFIPFVEYATPGTMELAENVSKALENEDVVLLKRHGIVACGENLDDAFLLAEFVEETAKIQLVSSLLSRGQTQAHLKRSI
ncbi:class II aldolase/adducin family protein [Methanobacterium paludis]|uniref:L-fuculose-phosphate aldolase n=1 Tax=Methanobacterium paludis (strain DSM 25820 / JCM 18151 / SWAN1) TaxID=868131 RepID=F6D6H7_METPW|nr:class II aldolase/adducin family protein [Methanobacterium paludis]AEG19410.1 L-fuculose-phosphate aldolase [Methanobacterium paludis]